MISNLLRLYDVLDSMSIWRRCDLAGGLSGAVIWQVTNPDGRSFCLRRWPQEHPDEPRLQWIHRVLLHVQRHYGERVPAEVGVPVPYAADSGKTYVSEGGHLWELTDWLPGESNFGSPVDPVKVAAAARRLAEFHLATESFAVDDSAESARRFSRPANSDSVRTRLQFLRELRDGRMAQIVAALQLPDASWGDWGVCDATEGSDLVIAHEASPLSRIRESGWELLQLFMMHDQSVERQLHQVAELPYSQQPCWRDPHRGNFLLAPVLGKLTTGQPMPGQPSGQLALDDEKDKRVESVVCSTDFAAQLVDPGAIAWGNAAGSDLGRFLGSFLYTDRGQVWESGVSSYRQLREISEDEERLAAAIAAANDLLGGIQWLNWLFVERRRFYNLTAVGDRIEFHRIQLASRL